MKKKLVASILMLAHITNAEESLPSSIEPIHPIDIEVKNKKDFFLFASGGISLFNTEIKHQVDTTFVKGYADDKSAVFEIGIGYKINENLFTELAYQRSMLDIADVDSGYLSLNYQFSDSMLNPYVGILGGYSKLKWDKRPYNMLVNENLISTSFLYGVQTGLNLSIPDTNNFYITAKYKYIRLDHFMNIRSNMATIEHNSVQNLLLGIKYEF